MKGFLALIAIAAMAVAGYLLFFSNSEKIIIEGNLNAVTQNSFDINAPQVTEGFSVSFIQGTAENISNEEITGIVIKYKIQGKVAEAQIEKISAKEKFEFKTNTIQTTGSNPPFSLLSVSYDE